MTPRVRALPVLLLGGAALAGCFEERARPGPPALSLTLNRTEVQSPDTLGGRLRATDPDGIDSLWLTVDSTRYGFEGFLLDDVEGPFLVPIPAGRPPGIPVSLRLESRDVLGFVATLDTFVRIAFPSGATRSKY